MGIADDAVQIRAQGWRTLAALHGLIEVALERELQAGHGLSVVEYTVLDALSRQDGWHMRMQQLARAAALSPSATTRLVNRLEDRGLLTRILCREDRRGIYTELTEAGRELLTQAGRPTTRRSRRRWTRPAGPLSWPGWPTRCTPRIPRGCPRRQLAAAAVRGLSQRVQAARQGLEEVVDLALVVALAQDGGAEGGAPDLLAVQRRGGRKAGPSWSSAAPRTASRAITSDRS